MAYTDTAVTNVVTPQDAGWAGIGAEGADWANSAFIGGLALSAGTDYAPYGLAITPDYANNQFSMTGGLAFIEDNTDIAYRVYTDSENQLTGSWNQPFLTATLTQDVSGVSLINTSGVNHIYLYYTHTGQNDAYYRVADTTADAPTYPSLKIAEIDTSANEKMVFNREVGGGGGGGVGWQHLGTEEFTTFSAGISFTNPDDSYDEYLVKLRNVTGTDTAIGSGRDLLFNVNNLTRGWNYHSTGSTFKDRASMAVGVGQASTASYSGSIFCNTTIGDKLSVDNRLGGPSELGYGLKGINKEAGSVPISSFQFEFSSGDIKGTFAIWGRMVQ